ncbi:Cysteine biosynthesis protein [Sphingomonas antarctica]|uniref:EI24 domain-containing protein n=1 Tax=Sphingomonas antarctica TaxID=2040274 RepID=UPI0039E91E14
MIASLALAIGDLFDRRVLAIAAMSLAITMAIFGGLGVALSWVFAGADPCDWLDLGTCPIDGTAGTLSGVGLTLILMWLLFPAVAIGVLAGFAEKIVAAVETRHYPQSLTTAQPLGAFGLALLGLRSSGRLLLVNIVALPFYLIMLVTGVGPLILFVIVNGWAAGRDFGEMVSARHGDTSSRHLWLKASRGARTGIGLVCGCLFLVPVLNLLAPILGAAAVTHLYHRRVRS